MKSRICRHKKLLAPVAGLLVVVAFGIPVWGMWVLMSWLRDHRRAGLDVAMTVAMISQVVVAMVFVSFWGYRMLAWWCQRKPKHRRKP